MTYSEVKGSLFLAPQGNYLAHCISGDYALGAGIATVFDSIYDMRYKLRKNYPIPNDEKYANVGEALLIDNVFNLVTKPRCYHKPTYDTLRETLEDMRNQCDMFDIEHLAMPKIGCGLDGLDWNIVREMIQDVFAETDINITVFIPIGVLPNGN